MVKITSLHQEFRTLSAFEEKFGTSRSTLFVKSTQTKLAKDKRKATVLRLLAKFAAGQLRLDINKAISKSSPSVTNA